jgi:hypothetical protein
LILVDVNVLIYAHRVDVPDHVRYHAWLDSVVNGTQAYGVSDLVLSGFLRVVTHRRVFPRPTPLADALKFVAEVRSQPHCVVVAPGPRHWEIFVDLCRHVATTANQVPDAYLAALAIESGSEWITADRGFARYPGLRWRTPVA